MKKRKDSTCQEWQSLSKNKWTSFDMISPFLFQRICTKFANIRNLGLTVKFEATLFTEN